MFYKDQVFDLNNFCRFHPGGSKAIEPYKNKDITDILFRIFPHPHAQTLKTLNRYLIGYNTSSSFFKP